MIVQNAREARSKGVVIFTRFCLDKKFHNDYLFCFFEGEDSKYYNERILKYTGYDSHHIINYNCGGKKQVIKAFDLINNCNLYSHVKKAFFIDKDFEPYDTRLKEEIYQTPCYSIENFYTSINAFERIISREFLLNPIDDDLNMCVKDFTKAQEKFHEYITFFNAWIFCQREKEREEGHELVNLGDFKISKLFNHITIDNVKCKRDITLECIKEYFPSSYDIDEARMNEVIDAFKASNRQQAFRGKFELEFLKLIIDDLKRKNKDHSYFSVHRECVRIDAHNNSLSTLSQYADTPDCLKIFLYKYRMIVSQETMSYQCSNREGRL